MKQTNKQTNNQRVVGRIFFSERVYYTVEENLVIKMYFWWLSKKINTFGGNKLVGRNFFFFLDKS